MVRTQLAAIKGDMPIPGARAPVSDQGRSKGRSRGPTPVRECARVVCHELEVEFESEAYQPEGAQGELRLQRVL